jgi:hypothetical protein
LRPKPLLHFGNLSSRLGLLNRQTQRQDRHADIDVRHDMWDDVRKVAPFSDSVTSWLGLKRKGAFSSAGRVSWNRSESIFCSKTSSAGVADSERSLTTPMSEPSPLPRRNFFSHSKNVCRPSAQFHPFPRWENSCQNSFWILHFSHHLKMFERTRDRMLTAQATNSSRRCCHENRTISLFQSSIWRQIERLLRGRVQ